MTTPPPAISVLMPTFRRPELLRRALDALAAQVIDEPFEVVVVDNSPEAGAAPVLAAARVAHPGLDLVAVHEARPGISHARNTALATARGRWVAFLDDDQDPPPGWLATLVAASRAPGTAGAFGPVRPELACAADDPLRPLYAAYFGRAFPGLADGADLTGRVAYLGTQNSVFDRVAFPLPATPFDPDLGTIGGEDSVFLRRLAEAGARFTWAAGAEVREAVPAARCTLDYVRRRRFRDGQIRAFVPLRLAPPRRLETLFWMAAGTAQALLGLLGWLGAALRGRRLGMAEAQTRTAGGLGKLLWGRPFRFRLYGG